MGKNHKEYKPVEFRFIKNSTKYECIVTRHTFDGKLGYTIHNDPMIGITDIRVDGTEIDSDDPNWLTLRAMISKEYARQYP